MLVKKSLGSAALIAVLSASGCTTTTDAESRVAYLDAMCPLEEHVEAFFEAQETGGWAQTIRAAGPVSVAGVAAADELDEFPWAPSVASHIPAISASLRATSAMWADVAESGTTSQAPPPEVVEADEAARDAVEAALQIEHPQACRDR